MCFIVIHLKFHILHCFDKWLIEFYDILKFNDNHCSKII